MGGTVSRLLPVLIPLGILLLIGIAVLLILRAIRRKFGNVIALFKSIPKENIAAEPQKRSVSGATSLYLPKIRADFPEFHAEEAFAAVKVFVNEYLAVRCGAAGGFSSSPVEASLGALIASERLTGVPADIRVHAVSITGYRKTLEYATIAYQASVGWRLDGTLREERYDIESTRKLTEHGVADKSLICERCGGAFPSASETVCPYCGTAVIRDTRLSWRFTGIRAS